MAYSHTLLFSDILDKVHKAKTKVEKVAILITSDSESLRMLLKASFVGSESSASNSRKARSQSNISCNQFIETDN